MLEGGMEEPLGKVDILFCRRAAEQEVADLVTCVPEKGIGHWIREKCAEKRGNDASADRPGKQRRHDHVRADKGRGRGERTGAEAERNGMGCGAETPKSIDDVAARPTPAATGPKMDAHTLQQALGLTTLEQHQIPLGPNISSRGTIKLIGRERLRGYSNRNFRPVREFWARYRVYANTDSQWPLHAPVLPRQEADWCSSLGKKAACADATGGNYSKQERIVKGVT